MNTRSDDRERGAAPHSVSHVAMITADLDRFRAFYEEVIGLQTAVVLRMDHPPGLRHALLLVDDSTALHAFEQPGYDPAGDGIGTGIGRRGRLDHLGFLVENVAALESVRDRLVAVQASEGEITDLGPLLCVHFRDPDGFEGEVNAVNPAFDPSHLPTGVVEEQPDPEWFNRLLGAVPPS